MYKSPTRLGLHKYKYLNFKSNISGWKCREELQGVRRPVGETQHLCAGHKLPDGASWGGATAVGSFPFPQPRYDELLCR